MATGQFDAWVEAAGWTQGEGGNAYGPQGARAALISGGGELPGQEMLCVTGESDGLRFAFAVVAPEADGFDELRVTELVFNGPAAIASGALVPWLDRLRSLTGVWARQADGSWWRLGGDWGHRKVPGPDAATEPQVNALLAALTRDPATAAPGRAARTLAALQAAGWKQPRPAKPRPGFRTLAAATLRTPGGAKHRVEYVLTGAPHIPEGLVWQYELPTVGAARATRRTLLIDVTGAMDPDLPIPAPQERLAGALAIIGREAPGLQQATTSSADLALAAVATVQWHDTFGQLSLNRRYFKERLVDGFPCDTAPPWEDAVAAVRAEPENAARWSALGLAAVEADRIDVAVRAFARAAELGTGDGVPLLWRGWLLRALDPDAALAELDRAAAAGLAWPARLHQAEVLRQFVDDEDQIVAAYARATEEAPEHVGGWLARGRYLTTHDRAAEAVQVLTTATARHADAALCHQLGRAQLLTGDHDGALGSLEQAVRLSPWMADGIVTDADLAPLQGQPQFDGLAALAAAADDARHGRARQALRRHDFSADLPWQRATDIEVVVDVLDIFRRKVDGRTNVHADGITHPATRDFLSRVGLPREAGDFELDGEFDNLYGTALREYGSDDALDERFDLTDHIPSGLGGLFILGSLGDDAEAAVDGATGEVYRVADDFSLTWLAPNLEVFFLPRCLPDDTWIWRVTPDSIDCLDDPDLARIGAGRLTLVAEELDEAGHQRLVGFLRDRGALLDQLHLRRHRSTHHDLGEVALDACCPNLRELRVKRGLVNESVFRHPALERLFSKSRSTRAPPGTSAWTLARDCASWPSTSARSTPTPSTSAPDRPCAASTAGSTRTTGRSSRTGWSSTAAPTCIPSTSTWTPACGS